jgi:hypothetical protein
VWGMQLKQHTTPCGCGNSLFTGGVCRGYPARQSLLSGPDLVVTEHTLLLWRLAPFPTSPPRGFRLASAGA